MRLIDTDNKEQFLDLLATEFSHRLPPEQARPVTDFARLFFETVPLEEVRNRRLADLYGAVIACWQFIQQYDHPKVRVFNPDLETQGWQSSHTVILILHHNIPFLMDSIRMELNRREVTAHTILHGVLRLVRDPQGQLRELLPRGAEAGQGQSEALMYLEIDRHAEAESLDALAAALDGVLGEVRVAVADYGEMRQRILDVAEELSRPEAPPPEADPEEVAETLEFLRWLADNHFTFLGYDEYELAGSGSDRELRLVPGTRLGILRSHEERPERVPLAQMTVKAREALLNPDILIFAKSAQRSRVHRPAYPDVVSVKRFDAQGQVIGERRFLGLYTAAVYHQRPDRIPLLRRKVLGVIQRSGLNLGDYGGRELDQILAVYPRDELFQIGGEELFQVSMAILNIQERRRIRLFMREDLYGQFVSALVYVPRDIYSTELRIRMGNVLMQALDATDIEFTTYFSESILVRTLFVLRVQPMENRTLKVADLESKLVSVARSWNDGLQEALHEAYGEEQANAYMHLYRNAFSTGYRDTFSPRRAALDIGHIATLGGERRLAMSFYRVLEEDDRLFHIKLFHLDSQLALSDVLPLFENMGMRVMGEHPFAVRDRNGRNVWIHDFTLQSHDGRIIEIEEIRQYFEDLFLRVWYGVAENDAFNRLVLAACLNWRQVALLRAYARYMRQIRSSYGQDFIAHTLASHVQITRSLLALFKARFDPDYYQSAGHSSAVQKKLEIEINEALEEVQSLAEDRVLRRYSELIRATLRTNFYQTGPDGEPKPYIALKFRPAEISEMPLPLPMFEIFLYSPRVEGVHLRGGKVARGGLRWSDRLEDYRTEVLGLVKAQQVKNAVIVPVGAKGGFVAKALPEDDREARMREGVECYRTFVRGLLDLTDNLVGNEVVPPQRVICLDEPDPYLVVAADKGTASFSDLANELSREYNFWLGDAFASGGSQGYDHKKMGITARGAWVSVERHCRELGIDPARQEFRVVGIGDMSGDVFGNGMLQSPHIRLVAAFNHMHIFIDPNPDPRVSFEERRRLFHLPRSTWADYNPALISPGGGVFSRSQKSIPISPEMKERFAIKQDHLPPAMLISALLRAPVDLIWNGGIGTYVKSSRESHADVGDKANDTVRVNGNELRARIVAEGGNLGMTQLGRIEYALQGGRLNTDFIDNSGGVDCSDHEVNIKILLNEIVAEGDLTQKQRNQLLFEMTDEVAELVLRNNYRQTQALSLAEMEAERRIEEYRRLIADVESLGYLNRALEYIPDDETITERRSRGQGLTRPELAILFAYVKVILKERLLASRLPDDPYMAKELNGAFPRRLLERFGDRLGQHRLRREIIATQIANDLVNHVGIIFIYRLRQSTGATVAAISHAYVIARDLFRLPELWRSIEQLDGRVESGVQMRMMAELGRMMRRSCRWLLRNRRGELHLGTRMAHFTAGIDSIRQNWPRFLRGEQLDYWHGRFQELVAAGVPEPLASTVAAASNLTSALAIISAQQQTQADLDDVARLFFAVGERLDLQWFASQIDTLRPASHWQALARETFREDLDWQQRALTVGILQRWQASENVEQMLEAWSAQHQDLIDRWHLMLTEMKAVKVPEFAMYSVALRELLDLAQCTTHAAEAEEIAMAD